MSPFRRPVLQFDSSTGTSDCCGLVNGLPDFASMVAFCMLEISGLVLANPSGYCLTKVS